MRNGSHFEQSEIAIRCFGADLWAGDSSPLSCGIPTRGRHPEPDSLKPRNVAFGIAPSLLFENSVQLPDGIVNLRLPADGE